MQFFHEVEEAEYWMDTTLSRIHLSFDRSRLQGDRQDAMAIMTEIKVGLNAQYTYVHTHKSCIRRHAHTNTHTHIYTHMIKVVFRPFKIIQGDRQDAMAIMTEIRVGMNIHTHTHMYIHKQPHIHTHMIKVFC